MAYPTALTVEIDRKQAIDEVAQGTKSDDLSWKVAMPRLHKLVFKLAFLGVTALLLTGAVPGNPEECKEGASDEKILSACTAYIDSGQYKGKDQAFAFYLRAIAHGNFEETDKAQADITKALELDPENENAAALLQQVEEGAKAAP